MINNFPFLFNIRVALDSDFHFRGLFSARSASVFSFLKKKIPRNLQAEHEGKEMIYSDVISRITSC